MRGAARLWETLLAALVMALAVAIAASCFVTAGRLSQDAYAQDLALGRVQAAADILSATGGDLYAVRDFFGVGSGTGTLLVPFDEDMETCTGEGAYVLVCGPSGSLDGLGTCGVTMARMADGEIIFGVTASWQEGAGHD